MNPPDTTARESGASPDAAPRAPRWISFALVVLAALAVAVWYVARASRRDGERAVAPPLPAAETLDAVRSRPHVMFLDTQGDMYRRIALASLDDPSKRFVTDVQCQRFHFARGIGLALGAQRGAGACVLDASLGVVRSFDLEGVPSRARVAPDGKRAGFTVFVRGDSYSLGGFSTRSYVLDLTDPAAEPLELEKFTLWDSDQRIDVIDLNYWGVTFPPDASHFYATAATNGECSLVRGDPSTRELHVEAEDVECPSVSPDGKRVAYKVRVRPGTFEWHLAVREFESGAVRRLEAEARSVDDQVEWLDDHRVLYMLRDAGPPSTLRPDVWVLDVDASSPPAMFLRGAMSPVVIRP